MDFFLHMLTNHMTFCYWTVVWNPWDKKSKFIADLGDKEYQEMLCVDGAALENPITLKPGEEWKGDLELSILLISWSFKFKNIKYY